jgi:hypothetical protein
MDSLVAINKDPIMYKNHKSNEYIWLFEWLDTKFEITDTVYDHIQRSELYKFVITEYSNGIYYQNKYFVKTVLKIFFMHPTKEQNSNSYFFMLDIEDKIKLNIYRKNIYSYTY